LKDRFDVIAALAQREVLVAQLGRARFDATAVFVKLRRHLVERLRQQCKFVVSHGGHTMREISACDLF
jgi:hypothetical protein